MKQNENDTTQRNTLGEERSLSSMLRAGTVKVMGLFVLAAAALFFAVVYLQTFRLQAEKLSEGLEEAYASSLGAISNMLFVTCQDMLQDGDEINGSFDVDEYILDTQIHSDVDTFMLFDANGRCLHSTHDTFLSKNVEDNVEGMDFVKDTFQRTKEEQFFSYMMYEENPEYLHDGGMNYYGYYVREDHRIAESGSVLITGFDEPAFNKALIRRLCVFARNAIVGQGGGFMIFSKAEEGSDKYQIYGGKNITPYMYERQEMKLKIAEFPAGEHEEGKAFYYTVGKVRYLCMYRRMTDVLCVAMIPSSELNSLIIRNTIYVVVILTILAVFMNKGLQSMLKKAVVVPVHNMTETMDIISTGSLDTKMNVRDNREFSVLSDGINKMVLTLKRYIKEAAERIDRELAIARSIQLSAVPNIFPAFPNRKDFDIYASMEPAKEVGGDFYDFFLVDDDHLALVIADVSDKGIPAAMFMMNAKAKLHDRARRGGTPAQILEDFNKSLCKMNKETMFVTVWLAIIELSTGRGLEANAGHEHPAFYQNESYSLVKYDHAPPVAVFPKLEFTDREFTLHPGDKIFVYTDGVTDAINKENERFGEDALEMALNELTDKNPRETIDGVREKVNSFAKDATQFDDMTMCAFIYYGSQETGGVIPLAKREICVEAKAENLKQVLDMVSGLESVMSKDDHIAVKMAVEEIFINIASYAYPDGQGNVTVTAEVVMDPVPRFLLTFRDSGVPYNPLAKEDPDITLDGRQRQLGGLGIFLVKENMDDMIYAYENGENILTCIKNI